MRNGLRLLCSMQQKRGRCCRCSNFEAPPHPSTPSYPTLQTTPETPRSPAQQFLHTEFVETSSPLHTRAWSLHDPVHTHMTQETTHSRCEPWRGRRERVITSLTSGQDERVCLMCNPCLFRECQTSLNPYSLKGTRRQQLRLVGIASTATVRR